MNEVEEINKIADWAGARIGDIMKAPVRVFIRVVVDDNRMERTIAIVLSTVCRHCKITIEDLQSKSRDRDFVNARKYACLYLTTSVAGISTTKIGSKINRDHSSVIHLRDTALEHMDTEHEFQDKFREISTAINNQLNRL